MEALLVVDECEVVESEAPVGAAIWAGGMSSLTASMSQFQMNTAKENGGVLAITGEMTSANFTDCDFTANQADLAVRDVTFIYSICIVHCQMT